MGSKPLHTKLREKRSRPPEGEPWVWFTRKLIESDAWQTAPINTRRFVEQLILEHMAHAGTENGKLICTARQCVERGIGGMGEVTKAQRDAIRRGLVYVGEKGFCSPGRGRRPHRFGLGWLPGSDGSPAPNLWLRWRAPHLPQDINSVPPSGTKTATGRVAENGQNGRKVYRICTAQRYEAVPPSSTKKMNLPPGWRWGKDADGKHVRALRPGTPDRPWIGVPTMDGVGDEFERAARAELLAWRRSK
jgi:hypothetical protein